MTLTYVQGPFPLKSGLPQTHHDTTVTNVKSRGLYPSWEGRDPPILLLCPATEETSETEQSPVPSLFCLQLSPAPVSAFSYGECSNPSSIRFPTCPFVDENSPAKIHVPWALKCLRLWISEALKQQKGRFNYKKQYSNRFLTTSVP